MKNLTKLGMALVALGMFFSINVMAEQNMLEQPVNCKTAEGDIRSLKAEKTHTGEQIVAGVGAITPIGMFAHMVKGDSDKNAQIATGDYNEMLDAKIAQIKKQCGM